MKKTILIGLAVLATAGGGVALARKIHRGLADVA